MHFLFTQKEDLYSQIAAVSHLAFVYFCCKNLHTMLERRGLEMLWGVVIV